MTGSMRRYIIFILIIICILSSFVIFKKIHKPKKVNFYPEMHFDITNTFYKEGVIPISGHGSLRIQEWQLDVPDKGQTVPLVFLGKDRFLTATSIGDIYLSTLTNNQFRSQKIYTFEDPTGGSIKDNTESDIKDIKVFEKDIFFTATHFYKEKNCYSLKLYHGSFLNETISDVTSIYEAFPQCPKGADTVPGELGGKFIILDKNHLLVAFGGGAVDSLAIRNDSDYGKTILFTLDNNRIIKKKIFTSGHRNPSGLFLVNRYPLIAYETEHGPTGGDELNRLVEGKNYGWPHVTYGLDLHEINSFRLRKFFFTGNGYEEPLFAWIPSIGISGVVQINNDRQFPEWKGDILVGSLSGTYNSGGSIYRLHIANGKINVFERIRFDERIRSVHVAEDGSIYFKTDTQKVGRLSVMQNSVHH